MHGVEGLEGPRFKNSSSVGSLQPVSESLPTTGTQAPGLGAWDKAGRARQNRVAELPHRELPTSGFKPPTSAMGVDPKARSGALLPTWCKRGRAGRRPLCWLSPAVPLYAAPGSPLTASAAQRQPPKLPSPGGPPPPSWSECAGVG